MNRVLALGAMVLAAACASCGSPTSRVVDVYGGAANWAAIEAPDRVQAFRIIRPGILTYIRAQETIDGFEIMNGPVDVAAATAKELATILADDSIYDFERAKGCEFEPGVAVRVAKGPTTLDILLCFSCDELAAYEAGKRVGGSRVAGMQGEQDVE